MRAQASRQVRHTAPQLSPEQARRAAELQAIGARMNAKRRAHPLRAMLLDLAVGLPITGGAIVLFMFYFGVIRW